MNKDIEYIFNNKVYNITKSTLLYEYIDREPTGMKFMGQYPMTREFTIRVYKSSRGNLYRAEIRNDRISISDITKEEFIGLLARRSELGLLRELYPETANRLEEV